MLPNASAGAAFQSGMASGKFHGVISPTGPERITERELQGVGGLGGDHLAEFSHGFAGVIAADDRSARDLAAGFGDRLADFPRHFPRQLVRARGDRGTPPVQHFGPTGTGRGAPPRECGGRGVEGGRDVVRCPDGKADDQVVRIGGIAAFPNGGPGGFAEGAPDEERDRVARTGMPRRRRVRVRHWARVKISFFSTF